MTTRKIELSELLLDAVSKSSKAFDELVQQLVAEAKPVNGRRRERICEAEHVEQLLRMILDAADDTHTIRIYCTTSFVPNSYKYRCPLTTLEAVRTTSAGDKSWLVSVFLTDAKRSKGHGAFCTINSRAA